MLCFFPIFRFVPPIWVIPPDHIKRYIVQAVYFAPSRPMGGVCRCCVRNDSKQCGAGKRSRTPDLRITNALLYQLSYAGLGADYKYSTGGAGVYAESFWFWW